MRSTEGYPAAVPKFSYPPFDKTKVAYDVTHLARKKAERLVTFRYK